jgi:acetyl-CoA hydrolase
VGSHRAPREEIDAALDAVLTPGQDIVVGQGNGVPSRLLAALARHRERLHGSRLLVGWLLVDELPRLPGTEVSTFFPSGPLATRAGMEEHRAAYVRRSLNELAVGLGPDGSLPVDVVLAQATMPRDGHSSFGVTVDYVLPAARRATATVLECGEAVPWTGPRTTIEVDGERVRACAVDATPIPAPAPCGGASPMARELLRWIPDGATLELGLGRWAGELLAGLRDRRGLRIHTGLAGDWLFELEAAGSLDPRAPVIATDAAGSTDFYAALEESDRIDLRPASFTHDRRLLASLPCLRAINSVLEVDLRGRVNTEFGTAGRLGGVAGLRDFAGGAAANPDGLSIIALPSSSRGRSRIVAELDESRAALAADLVEVVVTEQGSADLRGLGPAERARALIAVAAPEHRPALLEAAAEVEML